MFSESPELYDLIYGSFKDYESESAAVAELLQRTAPAARDVLDIGCGTGEHARHLQESHGYRVDGLDIDPALVELARSKSPTSKFWHGDMCDFSLGRSYDVVLCLFSAIGYVVTRDRLLATLSRFRTHLRPGGVAVVEPWFQPGEWSAGRVYVHTAESRGLNVVRMSHSTVRGHVSVLDFHYLIGSADGIEHRRETHELGLFTGEEMLESFSRAGFESISHDPTGLTGRGLYVGQNSSSDQD